MFTINILSSFFKSHFLHFGAIINQSPLMYLNLSGVLGLIHVWHGCTERQIEIGVVVLFLGVYNRWYYSRGHVVGNYTGRWWNLTFLFFFFTSLSFSFFYSNSYFMFGILILLMLFGIWYSYIFVNEYYLIFGIRNIS